MLSLKDVEAGYGAVPVLRGVSLDVSRGEIVAMIGANGAGKSTTLMAISGLVPPRRGEVVFMGEPIHDLPPNRIASLGIGQVPEGRRIFSTLTVSENLDMGAFLRRDRKGVKRDIEYIFSLFPVLAERRRQIGGTLSGGEQQMLAISRALMGRPKMLLLDEPSMGLAPRVVGLIFSIIRKVRSEQQMTIFLVEQNANLALKVADRGYVMENGLIVMGGSAAALLRDEGIRKVYLGL